jgi:TIR domain
MSTPKVFISYSHDSEAHKAWVLQLANDLVTNGIDVVLDQWNLVPGQDVSLFMQRGIANADRVLLVCSEKYVEKADGGSGGVGYERLIVTGEVVQSIDTIKFVPIIRNNSKTGNVIPVFLGPRLYLDFRTDLQYKTRLEELVREIHGAPALVRPPLGVSPFSGTPVSVGTPPKSVARDNSFLDNEWFAQEGTKALQGIAKIQLTGYMELRFGLLNPISKSQIELLNGVKQSEIRTFGWPIGITLENRDEYKPRPYGDGIRAEVSVEERSSGRQSYDYWALRSNGDFYLLQSLFEDSRRAKEIFFDTRIVRVTESLMFSERLYTKLGAPPEARIAFRVTHGGLDGRTLSSASPNRYVSPGRSTERLASSEFVGVLGDLQRSRVDDVRKILEPLFMLFDFMEFKEEVYQDIVRNFEAGRVR